MNGMKWWGCILTIGCAAQTNPDPAGPEDDLDISYEWSVDENGACPDSWLLTYSFTGLIEITDTPFGMGDTSAVVGGNDLDEIVIRVADNNGSPAGGQVLMTSFGLLQDFGVTVDILGDFTVITDLESIAYDECGLASGYLDGTELIWDDCGFGAEHGSPSWTPDEGAYGAGCVGDYRVEGIVECIDESLVASCEDAWFNEGINEMDYTYNQPLLDFEFDSPALERFTMQGSDLGAEMPTFTNNRTWLSLEGHLISQELTTTPDCLCGE